MFTPSGLPVKNVDPLMLLNMWAHHLNQTQYPQEVIFAGIGKPTYPLNEDFASAAVSYWQKLTLSAEQKKLVEKDPSLINTAIDYGPPSGTSDEKQTLSKALSQWYAPTIPIDPDDIIFTVGGSAALRMIFRMIQIESPGKKIIATLPYYPFYVNHHHQNQFHFINLLHEPKYRLTAEILEKSIQSIDPRKVSAFLFCDPNNPLGFAVGEQEWKKIAGVLTKMPGDIPIILDEAYAELTFAAKHVSLFQVAPELRNRLILLRSSTKGFSASGERIAVIVCPHKERRQKLIEETVFSYLHAPKSLQYAYAQGMLAFSEEKRKKLSSYYKKQVDFVQKRLQYLGIQFYDSNYQIEGTFYVLANLKNLFGRRIHPEAKAALGYDGMITTDIELCYSLLFSDQIMISPLSFFGADPHSGFVRITCSGGLSEMATLMDRLEKKCT